MYVETTIVRSSHQRCSIKTGVLRNFAKFTGKNLCQNLVFNKVALKEKTREKINTPDIRNLESDIWNPGDCFRKSFFSNQKSYLTIWLWVSHSGGTFLEYCYSRFNGF